MLRPPKQLAQERFLFVKRFLLKNKQKKSFCFFPAGTCRSEQQKPPVTSDGKHRRQPGLATGTGTRAPSGCCCPTPQRSPSPRARYRTGNPGRWLPNALQLLSAQRGTRSRPLLAQRAFCQAPFLHQKPLGVLEALLGLSYGEKIRLRAPTTFISGFKQARLPAPPRKAGTGSPYLPVILGAGKGRALLSTSDWDRPSLSMPISRFNSNSPR